MFASQTRSAARWQRWGVFFAAVGLLLLHIAISRPATANPHLDLRGPGVKVSDTWLGSYRTFLGEPWAWCIDAGKKSPFAYYEWTSRAVAAPQEAYLLHKYAGEATNLTHAALSFILHKSATLPHEVMRPVPDNAPEQYGAKLRQRVDALQEEARNFAGPYEISLTLTEQQRKSFGTTPRAAATTGTQVQAAVQVRAASGQVVPNVPLTLKASGGSWAGGETQLRLKTGAKAVTALLGVAKAGEVQVAAISETPPTSVRLYDADQPEAQRVVSALGAQTQKVRATVLVEDPLEFEITTRTSEPEIVGAGEIFDHLDIGVVRGQWPKGLVMPVESTLYGPFATAPELQDAVPQDAPVVAVTTTEVSGPGAWQTEQIPVADPGWYVWHEVVVATDDHPGWTGKFGVPAETFEVIAPPEPEPEPEPEREPAPEPEPEPAREPEPEPAPEPEPEPAPEAPVLHHHTTPELPRTGGSLALGMIGSVSLLAGLGTLGVVLVCASAGYSAYDRQWSGR